jgi:hypothetical protein
MTTTLAASVKRREMSLAGEVRATVGHPATAYSKRKASVRTYKLGRASYTRFGVMCAETTRSFGRDLVKLELKAAIAEDVGTMNQTFGNWSAGTER